MSPRDAKHCSCFMATQGNESCTYCCFRLPVRPCAFGKSKLRSSCHIDVRQDSRHHELGRKTMPELHHAGRRAAGRKVHKSTLPFPHETTLCLDVRKPCWSLSSNNRTQAYRRCGLKADKRSSVHSGASVHSFSFNANLTLSSGCEDFLARLAQNTSGRSTVLGWASANLFSSIEVGFCKVTFLNSCLPHCCAPFGVRSLEPTKGDRCIQGQTRIDFSALIANLNLLSGCLALDFFVGRCCCRV